MQVAKNLRDNLFQFVSSFAGDMDATKSYRTLADLQSDIDAKQHIYPGKIVYVFEKKKHYYIDLWIDGQEVFDETIKAAWLSHMNSLPDRDITTTDYELPGYTNTWKYDTFAHAELDVPEGSGYTISTVDGAIAWSKTSFEYNGDLSAVGPSTIFSLDILPLSGMKLFFQVYGTLEGGHASYGSTIQVMFSTTSNIMFTEYGVLSANGLNIIADFNYDAINGKILFGLQKSSGYVITKVIANIEII